MTDFDHVVESWERAARRDDARQAIHPSGSSDDDYAASGQAKAREVAQHLVRLAPTAARVVDFGCGDGRVARWLCPLYVMVGADASLSMLGRMSAVAPDVLGVRWDGRGPFPLDEQIDAVYTSAVFIHHSWADGEDLLAALAGLVKARGIVLCDVPLYDVECERREWNDVTVWTPERLYRAAERAGLEVVSTQPNPGAFSYETIGPNHGLLHALRRVV